MRKGQSRFSLLAVDLERLIKANWSYRQPFTFDVAELDELTTLAKKKNLFLMEAVWTRFVRDPARLSSLAFRNHPLMCESWPL